MVDPGCTANAPIDEDIVERSAGECLESIRVRSREAGVRNECDTGGRSDGGHVVGRVERRWSATEVVLEDGALLDGL